MRHSAIALGLLATLAVAAPIQDSTVAKRAENIGIYRDVDMYLDTVEKREELYALAPLDTLEKRDEDLGIYRDADMYLDTVEKRDDDMVYADAVNGLNTAEKREELYAIGLLDTVEEP
ncbi:hypothetical protein BO94DRAFT_574893 [Aspergillus sclerotioniger CBS 115572]|uniref:Uncharacterized protein n=1 Tax=Aspergillus sclerotioniger CBS 115572 TaxID=1450535 RepID=A0A317WR26_9EURO|nr:hypothetical protein BO94DRAFT_574893 [Aspergillus sclerotioniger CBS 115572]PWY88899.1 hypothetical protein BO94DRAFT_574893 [Aspergillus sclerotioniger CBS 115572]